MFPILIYTYKKILSVQPFHLNKKNLKTLNFICIYGAEHGFRIILYCLT